MDSVPIYIIIYRGNLSILHFLVTSKVVNIICLSQKEERRGQRIFVLILVNIVKRNEWNVSASSQVSQV